ncbi:uncharacterized protein LOC132739095 isoform X2 [Ruditapes philippinarum]|uniref:uncharacterized protein LOC132739095 isoform X2 n=1 Tax=Ruditapes philippinarum TaxID=129788 RepID=UPI00295B49A0|nr:uncharacterized protein LOC132739095 isoform X2 [Ruditapes philippinarum]
MNQSTKWLYFWVVFVLATFQFGLVFSFGALFPSIRDTFLTDRPTTATVQALLMGITTSFGVVSGVIINKFGLPVALLVSSICMSSGFAVSFIVTDIWYLYATIGVLGDTYVMYAIGLSCMSAVFGLVACAFIICANLVRLEHVNVAIGLIMTLGGLLSIGMGPIYGVIRDNTGSYNSVFPIFATAQGIAAVLLIEDFISRKLKKQPMKDVNNVDNISEETKIIHV